MLTTLFLSLMSTISSPQGPLPPPIQVLSQFEAKPDQLRRQAVETYSKGCRDRRARMRYRKQAGALSRFERVAADPNPKVRLAAVQLALCFGPAKSAPALSQLIADPDRAVSLKAMNQVADFSSASTTPAMIQWLHTHASECTTEAPTNQEQCIFALYATGQSARHEPPGSKLRIKASQALHPFLKAHVPKAREVTVVALSFVGSSADTASITELIRQEQAGSFTQANPSDVIAQFQSIAAALAKNKP